MNWLDSRVRTRLRVLAMTVLLSRAGLVDLDIVGWSSLSLSDDVYADGDGEDGLSICFSSSPCRLESDWRCCSRLLLTWDFSRSISLLTVIMSVVHGTRPTKLRPLQVDRVCLQSL